MLQQKPKVQESADAKQFDFQRGSIEFRNVSFGHKIEDQTKSGGVDTLTPKTTDDESLEEAQTDEIKYLFKDFSMKIEAGTTNAIVGPSGFGKTSMLHLMFRIYDPVDGEVLIDGQNVKDLTFESFRKHIVVVPQNGILFNDTIEQNLRYGNPDAT